MTDEDYLGYLLNALDADEQLAMARYADAHPEARGRLAELQATLGHLEVARTPDAVPEGLAVRTIGRLAAHLVATEPRIRDAHESPVSAFIRDYSTDIGHLESDSSEAESLPVPAAATEYRAIGGRYRLELLVAAGIGFLAFGLVVSAIDRVRQNSNLAACQNQLRSLHTSLSGYADTHEGKYPQIGTSTTPTADTFTLALSAAGQVGVNRRLACPVSTSPTDPIRAPYSYTLGYRNPEGELVGLTRPHCATDEHDGIPIAADHPTNAPVSAPARAIASPHRRGQNVLFAGGQVLFATSPLVGPNGDHIYQNLFGQVAAGANWSDVVLGSLGDRP